MTLFEQYYVKTNSETREALNSLALAMDVDVEEMAMWDDEKANAHAKATALAKEITGKIDMVEIRRDVAYKRTLDTKGVANVKGTPCKSMTAIATALGYSKQDYSRYCQYCSMPIAYKKEFETLIPRQFTEVYNIYKEKEELPNKFTWDMITPEMTANDIIALHNRLKSIPVDDNKPADNNKPADDNKPADNNKPADDKKPVDVPHIIFNEKLGRYEFKGATATEIQAFIHDKISTHESVDKLLIAGNMVIKIPKS